MRSWAAPTWPCSWPSAVLHNSDKEKNPGSSAEMKQRTKFESEEEAKETKRGRKEAEQHPEGVGEEEERGEAEKMKAELAEKGKGEAGRLTQSEEYTATAES